MNELLSILLGVVVVVGVTAVTGYFVAQEFAYMAVDRNRLTARANDGDAGARRALGITGRTSFMLSGAQLGITVTGLLAGYVAEPMIGTAISSLLGGVQVPTGVGAAVGGLVALLFVTFVQMVFGELVAKNFAIARPEPTARWLALSTSIYLRIFGPVIRIFDQAAALLLRAVGITPVEDVQHAATPRDLERIVANSRDSGELPADLSAILDRSLDFFDVTAGHAMVPRTDVVLVRADAPVSEALRLMAEGHSRLPVYRDTVDDVVGVIDLRDLLPVSDGDGGHEPTVGRLARRPVLIPEFVRLPGVLAQLREAEEEFACVVDEYGGLAGVLSVEDIAEELVGEIADEHDTDPADEVSVLGETTWSVPGSHGVDEVERLIGHELPSGAYETLGGLVIDRLGRFPDPGDELTLDLEPPVDGDGEPSWTVGLQVEVVDRRVPGRVRVSVRPPEAPSQVSGSDGAHAQPDASDREEVEA